MVVVVLIGPKLRMFRRSASCLITLQLGLGSTVQHSISSRPCPGAHPGSHMCSSDAQVSAARALSQMAQTGGRDPVLFGRLEEIANHLILATVSCLDCLDIRMVVESKCLWDNSLLPLTIRPEGLPRCPL